MALRVTLSTATSSSLPMQAVFKPVFKPSVSAHSPKIGDLNLADTGGESPFLLQPAALSRCQLDSNLCCQDYRNSPQIKGLNPYGTGENRSLSCSQWLSPNVSCIQTFGVRLIAHSPKIGALNRAGTRGAASGSHLSPSVFKLLMLGL